MANNAAMYDLDAYLQAGIDPKTKLPIKAGGSNKCLLKENIRMQLRVMDEQDAVNRYKWIRCPTGISGNLIERILYYRGSGMMFMLQKKFYFLPYALSAPKDSTGIDVYGRYTGVTPLPFNGTANDNGDKDKEKPWIRGLIFEPKYEAADPDEFMKMTPETNLAELEKTCILLHDYTPQRSQTIIPRQQLNDSILDVMAECIPFMRTALSNSTGVVGVRIANENEKPEVDRLSNALQRCALNGEKFAALVQAMDVQELTGGNVAKAEEFMLAMQSLDNYRLSLFGLGDGGLFQKKSHMLEAEQEMNAGNVGLINEDGLRNRQEFCMRFNSYFGTNLWCEPSEATLGVDRDGDMVAGNDGEAATEQKAATQAATGGNEE